MIGYAVVTSAIGGAIFNAVIQALSIEVLPNKESVAKDLGILNLASSGSQIIGTGLASFLVAQWGYVSIFPAGSLLLIVGALVLSLIRDAR